MLYCPRCGAELPDNTKICNYCGSQLASNGPTPVVNDHQGGYPNGGYPNGGRQPISNGNGPMGGAPVNPPRPPQPPVPPTPPQRDNNKTILIVVIIVAVIVAIIAVVTAAVVIYNNDDDDVVTTASTTVEDEDDEDDVDEEDEEETTKKATTKQDYNNNAKKPKKKNSMGIDTGAVEDIVYKYGSSTNSSVSIYNLNTGERFSVNGDKRQNASALVIFPIAYSYAINIDGGNDNFGNQIPVSIIGDQNGRGQLKRGDAGELYSISEMFDFALYYSDNNAINSLLDNYSFDYVENDCNYNGGYTSVEINRFLNVSQNRDNYVSANDLADMIYYMHSSSSAGKIILSKIPNGVSDENGRRGAWKTATTNFDFNGYTNTRFHEVASIRGSNGDTYLLVFMSDGKGSTYGSNEAAEIGEVF